MTLVRASAVVSALLWGIACGAGGDDLPPDVAPSAEAARPLEVGAALPNVELRDVDGRPVASRSLLDEGPVALVFYRGGW